MQFDPLLSSLGQFYATPITIKHWQLRDLLVSREGREFQGQQQPMDPTCLYPYNTTIHELNLRTGVDRPLIGDLDFSPRCLATYGDIVLAGGVRDDGGGGGGLGAGNFYYPNFNSYQSYPSVFGSSWDPLATMPRRRPSGGGGGIFATTPGVYGEGMLTVANLSTGERYSGPPVIGRLINNSVSLYSRGQHALVCNNDNSLYILDITPTGYSISDKIDFEFPLNHAGITPSLTSETQQTLAAVGDSPDIHLLNRGSRGWQTEAKIPTDSDYVLSMGFHRNGLLFAVASQNGKARIYDQRKLNNYAQGSTPLYQISTTRPQIASGSFRTLTFGTVAEDILFVSEHNNRVHMLDLRNFDNHQVLSINANNNNHNNNSSHNRDDGSYTYSHNLQEDNKSDFTHTEYPSSTVDSPITPIPEKTQTYPIEATVSSYQELMSRQILTPSHHDPLPIRPYNYTYTYTYSGLSSSSSTSSIGIDDRFGPAYEYDQIPNENENENEIEIEDEIENEIENGDGDGDGGNENMDIDEDYDMPPLRRTRISESLLGSLQLRVVDSHEEISRHHSQIHQPRTQIQIQSQILPQAQTQTRRNFRRDYHPLAPVGRGGGQSYRNTDISGLTWSGYNGGSLLVGFDTGVAVWDIDVRSRKVWQKFQLR